MPSAAENVKEIGTLIDLGVKCLEFSCKRVQSRTCSGYAERSRKSRRRGTTERSDGNRVRSARKGEARTMCLEGTTPKDIPHHCISANSSDRPGRHLSIATIRVYFCDDNGDNLRQLEVVLGATEMPRNIIAHELHKNSCNSWAKYFPKIRASERAGIIKDRHDRHKNKRGMQFCMPLFTICSISYFTITFLPPTM